MIIIDMKKPETCADCHIINGEYGICEILDRVVWGIPPKDCPIVAEIPNEHGNLIEQDKALINVTNICSDEDTETLKDAIMMVPVVVEASKETGK